MEERVQKYLAECGIASRRKCEEYIMQGKVKVNGEVVTELGKKVNEGIDKVEFEGRVVEKKSKNNIYILLNKPIGYVTTNKEQFGREKVLDLFKTNRRIVPVGRLDMYTSGALILTDDGDFVYKVTHPKHEIEKTYIATVHGKVSDEELNVLREGVKIEDYITSKAKVKKIQYNPEKNQTRIVISIHEGKNRQVRKMCEAIGKKVIALHRSKIGNVEVKDIPLGKWRYLTQEEVRGILGE